MPTKIIGAAFAINKPFMGILLFCPFANIAKVRVICCRFGRVVGISVTVHLIEDSVQSPYTFVMVREDGSRREVLIKCTVTVIQSVVA